MKKILLLLSANRTSPEALKWALNEAKQSQKTLHVVYVVDWDQVHQVERQLAESGVVGDKPGEEVTQALQKEYLLRGERLLADMAKQAQGAGVLFESSLESGDFIDICERLGRSEDVALMVVSTKKERFFKKLFEGTEASKLKGVVLCDLKFF